jgi:predicted RNA-binding Zn ribbon-like protein
MDALFIAGHPAIDFLNTSFLPQGVRVEILVDGRALLEWLVSAGLLDCATSAKLQRKLGAGALNAVAAEARDIREWARNWLERWRAEPKARYDTEIAKLNQLLAHEAVYHEVIAGQGPTLVERRHIENGKALICLISYQLAGLLAKEDPSLIKRCTGAGCSLWFLDRTKAHRRAFCSPTACGNRAKVAAFRERIRSQATPPKRERG